VLCVLQSGIEIPYAAIKTNIADSLRVIIQMERRPGRRFIAEVLLLRGFDVEDDKFHFDVLYQHRSHTLGSQHL